MTKKCWDVKNIFCWIFIAGSFVVDLNCEVLIDQQIQKICKSVPGEIGVAALHLESGQRVEFNSNKPFPMASTYKIPIALCCLDLVDQGKLSLEKRIKFSKYDRRHRSYTTQKNLIPVGSLVPIKELIQYMIEVSDNATSDVVLKLVGGPNVVTTWIKQHGIKQMRVDRSTIKMRADYNGITNLGDENCCTVSRFHNLINNVSAQKRLAAQKKFYIDLMDTTTPRAMVDLMELFYCKKIVRGASADFLLEHMLHCVWGESRMPNLLPKDTKVWHKTGSVDGVASDVGIVELPKHNGHLVLAFYTNKSMNLKANERAIARVSKALFDHFSAVPKN